MRGGAFDPQAPYACIGGGSVYFRGLKPGFDAIPSFSKLCRALQASVGQVILTASSGKDLSITNDPLSYFRKDQPLVQDVLTIHNHSYSVQQMFTRVFEGKFHTGKFYIRCLFYRIFGFSDFPKIRKIGISENPDFRVFRNFRNPISENPDFRESENPDFQISGLPNLRKSGFPEI